MPDPTLIVALRKKRLSRYGGDEDKYGSSSEQGDHEEGSRGHIMSMLEELDGRVKALEGMIHKDESEESKEGE